ncbi:creatininase family protein [Acidiferrimicrobium sp. IK]|uniref:creatininase family protein n=1 Tax=Acidiferrimicrobium sp. IK TaxID=2871700 RepID=UPI0021CB1561|nr:creatininase family protein [Acidiferrimicrobium sp. IK]MCU4183187.1 creatininase family protein [Acidiferrimicrobium sp. IK]
MPIRRFTDLCGPDAGSAGAGMVAVQPIGAVEHHGPHLPLATDAIIAEAVSEAVIDEARGVPLQLLPTLSYALSSEHLWAPGTVTLRAETLLAVLDDVGASLARAGVPRLVFVNGHGGNSALLRVACREIRVRHGLMTFLVHPSMPVDQGGTGRHDAEGGFAIHGAAGETSMVMHLRPDLVDLGRAERSIPDWLGGYDHIGFGGEVSFGWSSNDIAPSGVIGDPTLATAELGKQLFEGAVGRLAPIMEEISRFSFPGARPAPR